MTEPRTLQIDNGTDTYRIELFADDDGMIRVRLNRQSPDHEEPTDADAWGHESLTPFHNMETAWFYACGLVWDQTTNRELPLGGE